MSDQPNPNGELPELPQLKPQPENIQDTINRAETLWKFKKRDEAMKVLFEGMRLIAHGTSRVIKEAVELKKAVGQLGRDVD